MTLENNEPVVIYTGDGVTTIFDYDFRVDEVEDFSITIVNESDGAFVNGPLGLGSFGFTGLGEQDGGTIEYPLSGDPLATIYKIVIRRLTDATQGLEISTQSAPTVALENQLDEIVEKIQELQVELDQAYKANFGEVPGDLSDAMDAVLAAAATVTALTLGNVASATHAAPADASLNAGDEYPFYDFTTGLLRKRLQSALDAYYDAKYQVSGSYQPLDTDLTALGSFGMSAFAGMLWGCTLANNAGDVTNDIDFAAGKCIDSTNAFLMSCAAMTKRLDADWAPGTTNGMRYKGAAIANTTYHIYAAAKADGTQDYYADPSTVIVTVLGHLQAEVGGASYVYLRRIGSILRETAAIVLFKQNGDHFNRTITSDYTGSVARAYSLLALSVPSGIVVTPIITAQLVMNGAGLAYIRIGWGATEATQSAVILQVGLAAEAASGTFLGAKTNTSAQVYMSVTLPAGTLTSDTVGVAGWIDTRGRDA